jgi:hypothetical protein
MKVNSVKLFEANQISDEKLRQQLNPLIEFINSTTDQLVRAVQKGLTPEDNMDTEMLTIEFSHGISKDVLVKEPQRILGILAMKILHSSDAVEGLRWSATNTEAVSVTLYFREASDAKRKVNLLCLYK